MPFPDALLPPDRPIADGSRFSLCIDVTDGRIQVAGPLDHRTAGLVQNAFAALRHCPRQRWLLDLAGLTSCDRTGLRAIGACYRRAARHGRRLSITSAPPALRAGLTRLRLSEHLLARAEKQPTILPQRPTGLGRAPAGGLRPDGREGQGGSALRGRSPSCHARASVRVRREW